jgi:alkanesulfonate monooxygenase SsuD/methylene tetrahydromethanopterin reductase-like flavin-dependent oxidoreductase (luciferase family)
VPIVGLLYDLQRAPFAKASQAELYATALEQCEWADGCGFDNVLIGEHHGLETGYLPRPVTFAAAAAARTKQMRIRPMVLAPFYNPVALAEELAVVDLVSEGRLTPIIGAGYRAEEFEMFGQDRDERRAVVDDTFDFLKRAFTGEPFVYQGRRIRVTPVPHQHPRPPLFLAASLSRQARRAAHIADGFYPDKAAIWEDFREECRLVGRPDPGDHPERFPTLIHVTEDPDRDWPLLAPFFAYHINNYASWYRAGFGRENDRFGSVDETSVRLSPDLAVVTPDECLALCHRLPHGYLRLWSMPSGADPELSWTSLQLLVDKVLPRIELETGEPLWAALNWQEAGAHAA